MMSLERLRRTMRTLGAGLPSLRGLLPLIVGLMVWQLLQPGPSPYFPAPREWWSAGLRVMQRGQLLGAFGATTATFAVGLLLAIIVGTALGVIVGTSRRVDRALAPLLEFLRAIPPPAVVPIAALLMGFNEAMKLTVVFLAAIWPILLNVTGGVRAIDPLLLDVARSFRLTVAERIWRIVLPSIVPALLLGIRVALPLAIVVALLVEMLTSLPGIGAVMIRSQRNFQSSEVYALLVLVGLFGFVVNNMFSVLESYIMRRWPPRTGATA